MGPNGSGKSTLANTLLANPAYEVTARHDPVPGRGRHQRSPPTSGPPGASSSASSTPRRSPGSACSTSSARPWPSARASPTSRCSRSGSGLMEWTKRLGHGRPFPERYLNEGFSGGEKKRNEILQMAMMEPDFAVLDETDSGLDIDALRVVADGIAEVRSDAPGARHPADHALPAHPRPPHPRRRARAARRPHRRDRRPRARAADRGRGLRQRSRTRSAA